MDRLNIRVLIKEPRGFIRLLQALFSVLAWSTTAGFSTVSMLHVDCSDETRYTIELNVHYNFDLRNTLVSAPFNCSDDTSMLEDSFPIDFSCTAMLYVAVCALSLVYSVLSAIYYCFCTSKYETDPLAPMVDLCVTILITTFWIVITCTWALNVSDLKHFTHPNYFKDYLNICSDAESNCQTTNPGKWSSLIVSIVCGFICVLLWLGSTWFIFKETTLHKKQTYQAPATQNSQQQQPI